MELKKRIEWIDVAKGIGTLCVIFGHLALYEGNSLIFFTWVYSFHMPLFFFLSGLTYQNQNYKSNIIKKIKTLGVPYLLFSVLTIAKHTLISIEDCSFNIHQILKETLGIIIALRGSPYYTTLWFVSCIFSVFVIMKLFTLINLRNAYLGGVVLILFCVGIIYNHLVNRYLPWSVDVALISIFFFYLGFVSSSKLFRNEKISLPILGIAVLLSVVFCYLNYRMTGTSVDMYSGRYGSYLFFIFAAVAGTFIIVEVSKVLGNSAPVLSFVGKNSLFYYGAHLLFLEWARKPVQIICASTGELVKTVIYVVSAIIFAGVLSAFVPLYNKTIKFIVNWFDSLMPTTINKY